MIRTKGWISPQLVASPSSWLPLMASRGPGRRAGSCVASARPLRLRRGGGSDGAGSEGFSPLGCRAPASPARTAACLPLSVAWPGGLPALGPTGRWTPWHAPRPPGASDRVNEVGYGLGLPSGLGSGAGLVGGVLAAGGRACHYRPARSLHPGRDGRTRLPATRTARSPSQAACSARSCVPSRAR